MTSHCGEITVGRDEWQSFCKCRLMARNKFDACENKKIVVVSFKTTLQNPYEVCHSFHKKNVSAYVMLNCYLGINTGRKTAPLN